MRRIASWIDGKIDEASSDHTSPVFDPAAGSVQAEVALAGPAGVDAAVAAAKAASVRWGDTSIAARTKILFAFRGLVAGHADELARIVSSEHGKTIPDAAGEVQRGLEVIEFACGLGQILKGDVNDQVSTGVDAVSFRQPVGVVVGITPFNFPVMVPCWMHPIAIACGNTFILKPSERDPGASELIAELWKRAGLPDGVFNVVQGDASVVQQLLAHPDVDAVSFVGSTPIARSVHEQASRTGKRVQALGGAKNHAVVAPDADISFAAKHITAAGYGSAGQRCMAISAVVAVGAVADRLVEELRKLAEDVRVGPGSEASTDMGPVVTATSRDRIIAIIDTVTDEGATLVVDGRKVQVEGHQDGFFVGPTLIDHARAGMRSYDEEIFGPVLTVLRVNDMAEAIEVVNANQYGNGVALFTSSGYAAREFTRRVHVGMVGVNVPIPVPMAYHSFGGWKDSLFGDHHIHGEEGVRFYTLAKAVTIRWPEPSMGDAGNAGSDFHFPTSN